MRKLRRSIRFRFGGADDVSVGAARFRLSANAAVTNFRSVSLATHSSSGRAAAAVSEYMAFVPMK